MAAEPMARESVVIIHADDQDASARRSSSDPLTLALRPPPDESPQQRDARLKAEAKAKKISDDIDEQLKQEKAALKKRKEIKILLLGQSESGKSTTLKQFQILHTPSQFHAERVAWRAVIYLNLVRSIRRILQALDADNDDDDDTNSIHSSGFSVSSQTPVRKLHELEAIKARLAPIRSLEEDLIDQLSSAEDNEAVRLTALPHHSKAANPKAGRDNKEVIVRTSHNWKSAFFKPNNHNHNNNNNNKRDMEEVGGWWDDPNDPVHLLNRHAEDMITLWRHPAVKDALKRRRIRLQESSGFYLDEIERVTEKKYIPTDDDVLKARLKTIGVIEHCFTLDKGRSGQDKGVDWKIFDVGGARSQRQYWAPYFSDVDAIIFLAPISAFDQVLSEDPTVNRMEDSLLVWRTVVSNKLLENVNIVLFLNKCDLLEYKLDHGVKLNHHMTSYGDRPNNFDSISRYFKNKFIALHQSFSSNQKREVYIHLTAVTDTRKTSSIIVNVRDIILRKNLEGSRLI